MKIGISGGNGDLSGRTIKQLLANGFPPGELVVSSTNPAALTHLNEIGVSVRRADFSDPGSVTDAFTGCDRVLLISMKDHEFDIVGKEYHAKAVKACVTARVKHLMYTSAIAAFRSGDGSPWDIHADAERQLEDSGCNFTVIRNGLFIKPLEWNLNRDVSDDGIYYTAAGDGLCAWVSKNDIARATAVILTMDSPAKLYTLTGGEAVSLSDVISAVNDRFGTHFVHNSLSPEDYTKHLAKHLGDTGVEKAEMRHILFIYAYLRSGYCSLVTDDIECLTGQAPEPFIADLELGERDRVNSL